MRPFDARLLRLAPASRGALLALALLAGLSGLAAIAQAFAVSALVVALVRSQPLSAPMLWLLATFALRGLAGAATEVVGARAGAEVSTELRHALAKEYLHRDADSRGEPGQALTLMSQGATSVEPYVARYLPALIAAGVLPLAAVLAMAMLDWQTALIPVLTLPLLPLFAALIGATTADATARRWKALDALSGHFLDVMKGLPTLVDYGRAHRQSSTIRKVSDEHRIATVETLRLAFLSSAALEFLATISVAIVAVWTGIALAQGRMELPIALTLILLAPEAYWPIRRVGAEFHNAADGAAALEAIAAAVAPATPATETATGQSEAASVRVEALSYRYEPDLPPVIEDLNLHLSTGLTVLAGPSGAGKTTILDLLAGLRRPSTGRVSAPRAHLVTQRPFLAPTSVRENLALGNLDAAGRATLDDAAMMAALERVGLGYLVAELPQGLDTPLGDDGFGASAGQRARLALARALLSSAPLILLDEPTAHLDPLSEELIGRVIAELARDRIVVAVSHREHLATLAERVIEVVPQAVRGGQ
ncbi:thiol reductant ABC exporter subunit CydD [Gephyromycinifex aptenodytis]|uniref:thiol reductant ABC exporter subunit CydD n=1 Tax=Gephyromycinifex aptenodytis TaxID=2716227 RepID=UPI00144607F0|nr:thiol reductant ABC exporter subunit CydD [Gephyromycinifex aptenodytis]